MVLSFFEYYFKIFNSKIVQTELEKQLAAGSGTDEFGNPMELSGSITKSGISKDYLNFFLNRKQFYESPNTSLL